MRLANRSVTVTRWAGVFLGLLVCSFPLMAIAAEFKPPKRGIPGRREGGGTRDGSACVQDANRLTVLVPQTNLGLTTAAYPRFFWFMPQTRAKFVEFSLYEADENLEDKAIVYTTTFSITGSPGVASLKLPESSTLPPLAVGKDYRWSIAIVCNPNDRKRDIFAEGWVQRIKPETALSDKLSKANPSARVDLYAENGIWFETLNTLADLRCTSPNDAALKTSWATLMKSVKLDAIADQPLVQQCR